jgi:hypothetical protein
MDRQRQDSKTQLRVANRSGNDTIYNMSTAPRSIDRNARAGSTAARVALITSILLVSTQLLTAAAEALPSGALSVTNSATVSPEVPLVAARLGVPRKSGEQESLRTACALRELALGSEPRRQLLSAQEQDLLESVAELVPPKGAVDGVNVSVRCQIGYFVQEGKIVRVFRVSTGAAGLRTGIGTFRVGWKVNGWRESRQYPGSMLYRPLFFNGGEAIHGLPSDSSVKTYPASHGCVRTPKVDVDWIWEHWDSKDRVRVYGSWR